MQHQHEKLKALLAYRSFSKTETKEYEIGGVQNNGKSPNAEVGGILTSVLPAKIALALVKVHITRYWPCHEQTKQITP